MNNMTWRELKDYLNSLDDSKLDRDVAVYDMASGDSLSCDIIELQSDKEWSSYIGINLETMNNE